MPDTIDELKRKSVLAHRILARSGCSAENSGHVFIRIPGTQEMLVRCRNDSDWSPTFVGEGAIRRFDLDGNPVEDLEGYVAPPERYIGAELLKARPEIGCVIHGHPWYQVLCDASGVPIRPIVGFRAPWSAGTRAALEGIPVFPRSILIASPEAGRALLAVMGGKNVCILRGHGNVVVGRTVEEATTRAIQVENLARFCYQVALIRRDAPDIPWEDVEDAINQPQAAARQRMREGRGVEWNWAYYVRLLEESGSPLEGLLS